MDTLKQLGLTNSEIKVYLALLDLGDCTRNALVNKSQIAGSKIYEIIERLQQKGLVGTYIKNKVTHFKPTNPKQLLHYLEEKKDKLQEVEDNISSELPQLLALYKSTKEMQEVELLKGLKGLQIVFQEQVDMLDRGDTCYVIGGTKGSDEEAVQAFFQKIHVAREEKGILTKMLFNKTQVTQTAQLFSEEKYPLTTTKYITHKSPVAINIYKNRVTILTFGDEITAVNITSTDIANSMKEYFDLLWNLPSLKE